MLTKFFIKASTIHTNKIYLPLSRNSSITHKSEIRILIKKLWVPKISFRYSFQKWADVKLSVIYVSSKENERNYHYLALCVCFVFYRKLLAKINENLFPKTKHVKKLNHFCENFWQIFTKKSASRKYLKTRANAHNLKEIGCFCQNLTSFRENKKSEVIFANMEISHKLQYEKLNFAKFRENEKAIFVSTLDGVLR